MKKIPNNFTQQYVKSIIEYNPSTGIFIRKDRPEIRPCNRAKWSNKICNYIDKKGYMRISIDYVQYQAQRLAWFIMTGEWPEDQIDHKDGNKLNNKWDNLRKANNSQNTRNTKTRKDSTTGLKGISPKNGRYIARINTGEKRLFLGYFDTPDDAYKAYCEAAKKYHGEFARIS